MITIDDTMRFLIDYAKNPRTDGYASYGYEIYLPHVIHAYRKEVLNVQAPGYLGQGQDAERLSPTFYDAAWELCRRGIFRPGLAQIGIPGTGEGA